nr:Chain C, 10-mer peptide from Protein Nef [Human immunodeficiency virus 1]3QZW_C Chain C, 10-mer peptide from Protein Nef [Human immunodeficiency virus 1]3QZW_F Chain F, 10-mer peptide from Protein Nef [Human immunodeficiency virus 1]3VXN_C Chain C, 10-mer peptide from Protein Nef [Human immunodeficiency virus 1]3VXR_C Chain C, 10-mer peptide from Protein Nef [Human immunodeficiency virus 1]5HGH_C Chain C, Protein Nef [Human immunodeficiency virus 1]5XOV_C Chain C, HIV-1 Nef138-10 peptide [
RYPLTFGWCF